MISRLMRFKIGKSSADVDALLRSMVAHAYAHVPFYHRVWEREGVSISSFRGRRDLQRLPVITKSDLLAEGLTDRLSVFANPDRTVRRGTSGTSGPPIETHMTRSELRFRQLSLLLTFCQDAGWPFPMNIVEAGAWIPPASSKTMIRHRYGFGSTTHISRIAPLAEQVQLLAHSAPGVLTGPPSSLKILATESLRLGTALPRPRLVVSRGEVLRPDVRGLLRSAFNAQVVDYYNSQEIGCMARQCRENPGVMHVNHDACVLEVVDEDGHPVTRGCEGNIVVTSLYGWIMPLVRYKIGDRTTLVENERTACGCGRKTEMIRPPMGREDDLVVLPNRERIAPEVFADILMAASRDVGIDSSFTRSLNFQIVQNTPTRIVVRIASHRPCSRAFCARVVTGITSLHRGLECEVEEVAELEIGRTGKVKMVLSCVDDECSCEAGPDAETCLSGDSR